MNNILKQLQEKGEAELDKEFGYLYNYEVKDEYCAKDFDYEKTKSVYKPTNNPSF